MITDIPPFIIGERLSLRYEKIVAGNEALGLVPFYHFKIVNHDHTVIGHINFRVGETSHIQLVAGHIGYEILSMYRGNSYSLDACLLLAPFIRRHYHQVRITVDPENYASISIIKKLGAEFLDEVDVPENDPAYKSGARRKMRFNWTP